MTRLTRSTARRTLALSTVLAGGMLMLPAVAAAQAYGNFGTVVSTSTSAGGAAPTITPTMPSTTLNVDLKANSTVINWTTFQVPDTYTANFTNTIGGNVAVLNRVTTVGPQSDLGGKINGIGGVEVWVSNPNGILLGANTNINTQGFVATTRTIDEAAFNNGTRTFALTQLGGASTSAGITGGAAGAKIFTHGGLLALIAPVVQVDGTFNAGSGQAAFVAAEDVTFTADAGSPLAFTINRGASLGTGLSIDTSVNAGRAYMIVSAQTGIDALLNVRATVATATATPAGIVILAGQQNAAAGVTFGGGNNGGTGRVQLAALSSSAGGTLVGASNGITFNASLLSAGAQQFDGAVTLAKDALVRSTGGGALTFNGTVDGAHVLTADTTGTTTFGAIVGGTTPLTNLITSPGGTTVIGGTAVNAAAMTFNDQVQLTNAAGATFAGGSARFNAGIDGNGHDLTLDLSSDTVIDPAIVNVRNLSSGGGGRTLVSGTIATTGSQTYDDALVLTANTVLTTPTAAIALNSSVNGAYDLTVTTAGTKTLGGAVGAGTALNGLTLNGGGTIRVGAPTVRTTGDQLYADPVTLTANSTLTSAGAIDFSGTVDSATPGAAGLSATAANGVTFGGAVGAIGRLAYLTSNLAGDTVLNGGSVETQGDQRYGTVTLGAATTLTGARLARGAVTGNGYDLTLAFDNAGPIDATLGGIDDLSVGWRTGIGTPIDIAGPVTTTGAQTYRDAALLSADATLTAGGDVTFQSTLDGGHDLTIDTGQVTRFGGAVGGLAALHRLTITGGGTTAINGGLVRTVTTNDGPQNYNEAVVLGADATLTGYAVAFNAGLTGNNHDLTLQPATAFTVNGGVITGVRNLTVSPSGGAGINLEGTIATSGSQAYNGAITLGSPLVTLNAGATGDVTFGGTLNGASDLVVNAGGTTRFGGNVGLTTRLISITTDPLGATAIDAAAVYTTGAQSYGDEVTIGGAGLTHLLSDAGGAISFGGSVDAATAAVQGLRVTTTGTTTFGGPVGFARRLASLNVDGGGATAINGGGVTTENDQNYGGAITLGADAVLTGRAFNRAPAATLDGQGHDLELYFDQATINGSIVNVRDLTTGNRPLHVGTTRLGGTIETEGRQLYGNATTLIAGTTLTAGTDPNRAGDVTFASTLDGAYALAVNSPGVTTFGGATTIASLVTDAPGTTAINGGLIRTLGNQDYGDAVSIGQQDATLQSTGNGTIRFRSTVDSAPSTPRALDVTSTTNAITFDQTVGATNRLASLDVSGSAIALNGATVATVGAQSYTGLVYLGQDTTLLGDHADFLTGVRGNDHDLTLTMAGAQVLHGSTIQGVRDLLSDAPGTLALDGALATSGSQTYADPVTLTGATALASSGGAAIAFGATIDGAQTLAVNTAGAVTFGGAVGAGTALTDVTVTAGAIAINGGRVRSTGGQTYNGPVTIGASGVTLVDSAAGPIRFAGTIDGVNAGAQSLTVSTPGLTTFGGAIGSGVRLGGLTADGGGTTALNARQVLTTGSQTYADDVVLGAATLLDAQGGDVAFGGTLDGGYTLNVLSSGATSFANVVGGVAPLLSLTTDAGGSNVIGADLSTIYGQSFGGSTTLTGPATVRTQNGATIAFDGSIDGGYDLTVATAGLTRFGGAIGGGAPLASLRTDAGGSTELDGDLVVTTGAQTFGDRTLLGAPTVLRSDGGGTIRFADTLDGSYDLTVATAGTTEFDGAVGGTGPLGSLSTDAGGTTLINGGLVRTTGAQTYLDLVSLGLDTVLTGADITVGAGLEGNGNDLTLNVSGTATLTQPITGLGSLTTNGANNGAGTTVLSGTLETTGAQTYNTAVRLAGSVVTTSSGGAAIAFNRAIDGTVAGSERLTVNTAGQTTFGGAVGSATALRSLETDAPGGTLLAARAVTTTEYQQYRDAVTLGSADVLTSGTDVSFGKTVDGGFDLTVHAAGTTSFADAVGAGAALQSLTVDAGGTTVLGAGTPITVRTLGSQRFGDAVLLGSDTLLRSEGSGLIELAGTVDDTANGAHALTLETGGTTRLGGLVGGAVGEGKALNALTTDGGGATEITGGGVTTTGGQQFGDMVRVGTPAATLTSTGGAAIGFGSAVDGLAGAPGALTVSTAGTTTFTGSVGLLTPLAALDVSAGPAAIDGGFVITSGDQSYSGPATIGGDTLFRSVAGGAIGFGSALTGAHDVTLATGGITRLDGPVTVARLLTDAGGTTRINGGSVTTTGAQTYLDAVTIGAKAKLTSTGGANLTFGQTIDGGYELSLATAGNVILSGVVGGTVPLDALALRAASVSSVAGNRVTRIAADVAAGLTFDNAGPDPLTVGTVDGLLGINTGSQPTRLSAGGLLTLANDITASEVALTGAGIKQNAGVTVNAGAGTILLRGGGEAITLEGTLTTTNSGGGAVAIVDGGATTLGTIATGAGGTLTLGRGGADTLGSVAQTAGTHITTGTLLGNTTGATALTNPGNTLDTIGAFTAQGFALRDASNGLVVAGPLDAGAGDLALQLDAGALTLAGNLVADPGTITLVSAGAIGQTGGVVVGGALTGSSVGGTTINALSVDRLGAFTNVGAGGITLNNGRTLTVTGDVAAGSNSLAITALGIDFTDHMLSAGEAITLTGTAGNVGGTTATAGTSLTASGQGINIATATATGGALTLTAVSPTGDLTVGAGKAGTSATLNSAGTINVKNVATTLTAGTSATLTSLGKTSFGTITAGGALSVSANDLDITGAPSSTSATSVTIVNNERGSSAFNVGAGAADGFALTDAEVNTLKTPVLTLDGGIGRFSFGNVTFGDDVGSTAINVYAINPGSRIDVLGAVKGTAATRTIRFGGNGASTFDLNAPRAGVIQIVQTQSGGGSIDFANATVDLYADRIGAGRTAGFLSTIGFDKPGGLSIAQVTNLYTGNAASTLYNVRNSGNGDTPNNAVGIRADKLNVLYTDYALFQNTADQGLFSGAEIGSVLTIKSSGTDSNQNTFALFGSINGVTGTATAVQGPTVISFSQIFTGATRVNGCLIGTGAGCLTSVVTQPPLNVFDASRLDVFRSADDLVLPFDPLVGSNNEALFSGITLLDVPISGTQCANDATDPSCKQQTQTEGK